MKKIQTIVVFLLIAVFGRSQTSLNISQSIALQTIQSLYNGQLVDYYIGEGNRPINNDTIIGPVGPLFPGSVNFGSQINSYNPGIIISYSDWLVYVDESPLENGQHSSSCYWIRKKIILENGILDTIPYLKAAFDVPLGYNVSPVAVSNHYGTNSSMKPLLYGQATSDSVSSHTHVIILNGVDNKYQNYERSWNDCSYMYQVLTKKYGIPKQNIHALCKNTFIKDDGTAFAVSSDDMDMDNLADGNLAPTYAALYQTIISMSSSLTQNDHLFLYITGKCVNGVDGPVIKLQGNLDLSATYLKNFLNLFNVKDINVVLSVNNASAFADSIQGPGRVITAACGNGEAEWSCNGIPFSEFAYQWISAINQTDLIGYSITSDTNSDGIVSMAEAFAYASSHVRYDMHPVMYNGTLGLAEKCGFAAPSYDLYIKDNATDTGDEPNLTTNDYTHSPDITISGEFGDESQWLFLSSPWPHTLRFTTFDCAIKISNKGNGLYNGNHYVGLYWRCAELEPNAEIWHLCTFGENHLENGLIEIPVNLNTDSVVCCTFYDENLFQDIKDTNHSCTVSLMAKIFDSCSNVPLTIEDENMTNDAKNHNDIAIREYLFAWDIITGNRNIQIKNLSSMSFPDIHVTLTDDSNRDTKVLLTSVEDLTNMSQTSILSGETEITVRPKYEKKGTYIVTLIENNKVIDAKSISLE